ncbi:polysaccharide biosynthesis/export family protein [Leeuwenhoekiella sp. CH_XMU1409-2]|uniref:polysaccharide biosynthesis/export family protein n=1 Tax=Leeuwenhoekiella sp. CH_XMU1409-2 TaxID=3107768 RepID=UPI003007F637
MKIIKGLIVFVLFHSVCSCISRKEIVYLHETEMEGDTTSIYHLQQLDRPQLRIKPNDQIRVSVSAEEQEAALPFNLPVVGIGNVLDGGMRPVGTPQLQNYLVDENGAIHFPVLGDVVVGGFTRKEAAALLEKMISDYVQNPIVNVRLANFQISVLGEVIKPGTFPINDEYISLPKALGLAGDMTIYGRRDNVLVMREEKGGLTKAYLDLSENEVVNSPYYYLQQNDVVYVEPNGPQKQSASYNRNASIYISVASVLVSLAVLISR